MLLLCFLVTRCCYNMAGMLPLCHCCYVFVEPTCILPKVCVSMHDNKLGQQSVHALHSNMNHLTCRSTLRFACYMLSSACASYIPGVQILPADSVLEVTFVLEIAVLLRRLPCVPVKFSLCTAA